jgi:tRNA/tmRNA/rRNA uracil-C5-methylase (TrmA/RlmC/RlmD family)
MEVRALPAEVFSRAKILHNSSKQGQPGDADDADADSLMLASAGSDGVVLVDPPRAGLDEARPDTLYTSARPHC